jgi:hypothetical protein
VSQPPPPFRKAGRHCFVQGHIPAFSWREKARKISVVMLSPSVCKPVIFTPDQADLRAAFRHMLCDFSSCGFDSRPVPVPHVVANVALGQAFLRAPPCSHPRQNHSTHALVSHPIHVPPKYLTPFYSVQPFALLGFYNAQFGYRGTYGGEERCIQGFSGET